MKKQHGFTLVEVSIVLISVLLLLGIGLNSYNKYKLSISNEQFSLALEAINGALIDYHALHCSDVTFVQPTVASLTSSGFLSSDVNLSISFVSAISVTIDRSVIPPSYDIDVTLKAGFPVTYYASKFDADSVSGSTLTWSYPIVNGYGYSDNNNRLFKKFYSNNGDC